MKKISANDWHRADVVAELKKRGWTVSQLSREAGLNRYTLYSALDRPYLRGERIIAKALNLRPEEIWPERYAKRGYHPVFPKAVNA